MRVLVCELVVVNRDCNLSPLLSVGQNDASDLGKH